MNYVSVKNKITWVIENTHLSPFQHNKSEPLGHGQRHVYFVEGPQGVLMYPINYISVTESKHCIAFRKLVYKWHFHQLDFWWILESGLSSMLLS